MSLRIFQVDAFTAEPFCGNPAAVCLLDQPKTDRWMQGVAAEMNLSETAFVEPSSAGFGLRWFTPTLEVPLCGHATLASAHVLWETGILSRQQEALFHTLSGELRARWLEARVELNLPAQPVDQQEPSASLWAPLGEIKPRFVGRTSDRGSGDHDFLLELSTEDEVASVAPDFSRLASVDPEAGWIVTCRASNTAGADFYSRYFAPAWGVDEDPVTGVAHCALVPFWSERLNKSAVVGYQASRRGGWVHGQNDNGRVRLAGTAVTVMQGEWLA